MSNADVVKTDLSPARPDHALLIVDMISDRFDRDQKLFNRAVKAAQKIAALKEKAVAAGVPVIYLNDGFDLRTEPPTEVINKFKGRAGRSREIVELLEPGADDHFIVKPHRSGFYGTPLGSLLLSQSVSNVVITGMTTDICVLFTAHDAFMRGYYVYIPADCVFAMQNRHHIDALAFMKRVAEAEVCTAEDMTFTSRAPLCESEQSASVTYLPPVSGMHYVSF